MCKPLLISKHVVFQIKLGRLYLKRINEDVLYEIGSLAGWGGMILYKEAATSSRVPALILTEVGHLQPSNILCDSCLAVAFLLFP